MLIFQHFAFAFAEILRAICISNGTLIEAQNLDDELAED